MHRSLNRLICHLLSVRLFLAFCVGHTNTIVFKGFYTVIDAARASSRSQSQGAQVVDCITRQNEATTALYNGRYPGIPKKTLDFTPLAPPIELSCSVFAKFRTRSSDPALYVSPETRYKVAEFMKESSALFPNEPARSAPPSPLLERILGIQLKTIKMVKGSSTGAEPDRAVEYQIAVDDVLSTVILVVQEDKNEKEVGGCDVTVQGPLYLQKLILQVSSPSIAVIAITENISRPTLPICAMYAAVRPSFCISRARGSWSSVRSLRTSGWYSTSAPVYILGRTRPLRLLISCELLNLSTPSAWGWKTCVHGTMLCSRTHPR